MVKANKSYSIKISLIFILLFFCSYFCKSQSFEMHFTAYEAKLRTSHKRILDSVIHVYQLDSNNRIRICFSVNGADKRILEVDGSRMENVLAYLRNRHVDSKDILIPYCGAGEMYSCQIMIVSTKDGYD